jgi:FkbM family methyltransferase
VGHRFRELWAVEPDGENFFRLRRCIDDLPVDEQRRIHLLPCAVGRENQTRRFFDSLDFASQFCTYGNVEVQVRTVDDLDVRPTFIKAHLEGAEMDAILGGINTIRKNLPLVALSVYHNRLGLWECPKTLMDTFGDCGYRFVFRLHSWHGTGAVLYLLNR